MNHFRRFDPYTTIITLLIPFVLVVAWGASTVYSRNEEKQWCTESVEYLHDMSDLSSSYTNAGIISFTDTWINDINTTPAPPPMRPLRDLISKSVSYAKTLDPELSTTKDGIVYDNLVFMQDQIQSQRKDLIESCSKVAPLLHDAFPMIFKDSN